MSSMSVKRLTLDTNILIYAINPDEKNKHKRAMSIVEQAAYLDCVLTLQSLSEFYTAATRKKYMQHEEATLFIKELMVAFPIISSTSSSLTLAFKAVKDHNISFWDAMLWASAKENSCSFLISEDFQHDFVLGGIKIKNPFFSEDPLENLLKK